MNFDFLNKLSLSDMRDEKEIAKKQEELERLEREKRFRDWQEASGIGKRYRNASLRKTEYEKEVLDFLDKKSGFLVLLGKAGTGKTYLACALLNRLVRGFYTTVPDIEDNLHDYTQYAKHKEHYKKASFLVIDEIGREKNESEFLYSILNARYADRLPTVLISNLTPEKFSQHLGVSIIDRIAEDRVVISFTGDSRRRK